MEHKRTFKLNEPQTNQDKPKHQHPKLEQIQPHPQQKTHESKAKANKANEAKHAEQKETANTAETKTGENTITGKSTKQKKIPLKKKIIYIFLVWGGH